MGSPKAAEESLGGDAAPAGALTAISSELIVRQRAERATEVKREVKRLFGTGRAYRIGAGDIVNIVVWGHPEMALTPATSNRSTGSSSQADVGNGYNVNPDGVIQFPFLGPVKIAGLTENQARELLTNRIAKYIRDPQLTVRVQAYRHDRVYIDGEVRVPGLQTMDDVPMTLPEAINRAGGFTPQADRSSVILTRKNISTEINLPQLTRLGVNPNRILLAGGDLLRVVNRDESKIFVLGEVTVPRALQMRDGRLSLTEALGEAGGASQLTSNPRQIYVIRKVPHDKDEGEEKAEIYHLDAGTPTAFMLANDFELKARDVVFIDAAPVVRWNRVISNVLPSYNTLFVNTRNTTR
ncbi:polysaccharide export outer membrane protein [Pollutimonas bauzanensis]|uniref:Polysaccharide export outer membrane protein n=2 Tax=Pollutimonas bauzanensis TaxID=658167 RepID=A0A1M5X555_9BURK|nr:polysaccharide export outer membrane protein [Pollutimonas bauzanensis]